MSGLHTSDEYEFSMQAGRGRSAAKSDVAAASPSPSLASPYPDSIGSASLSIAVIGPNEPRRALVVSALAGCAGNDVREFFSYPTGLGDVPRMLGQKYDVIAIDLDTDPECALELVESISGNRVATVMVYSETADASLVVRCMRAGAREFLTLPLAPEVMTEALVRAAARRPLTRPGEKAAGKLLTFMGAKGGSGTTMLACNLAVALARDPSKKTLLIDLNLPLGDAALNLGVAAEFSTIDALQAVDRLDARFLAQLLVKHSSGLSVLAAPGKFVQYQQASEEAVNRLLEVAREEFDHVVIDSGSQLNLMGTVAYKGATTFYLVTQAGIAELRNSNRLIAQFFTGAAPKLEIVINRFEPRLLGVSEEHITKALTRPARWKIPNGHALVSRSQVNATPLVLGDSGLARVIQQMARTVTGRAEEESPAKKKGFSLKGFGRKASAKPSEEKEDNSGITKLGLTSSDDEAEAAPTDGKRGEKLSEQRGEKDSRGERKATLAAASKPTDGASSVAQRAQRGEIESAMRSLTRIEAARQREAAVSEEGVQQPERAGASETRTYKGVTYRKGADGQWHVVDDKARAAFVDDKARAAVLDMQSRNLPAPAISWAVPVPIAFGTPLSATELNASAQIPGSFAYAPDFGEVLAVGHHTLAVIFAPEDKRVPEARAAVSLTITKATPIITWQEPEPIVYGTPLSPAQLRASLSVPGEAVYIPAMGTVLPVGMHMLTVIFNPTDDATYNAAQAMVSLTVAQATPSVSWPAPRSIAYGTPLGEAQLNATSPVAGSFEYIPAAGEELEAGSYTLRAVFRPEDAANYTTVEASVPLTVTKATPIITWQEPEPIVYGTPISSAQLRASLSVPGEAVYIPAMGTVLPAGKHKLTVIFNPTDGATYNAAQATVSLTVAQATPSVIWPAPRSIAYGTPLGEAQLNATSPVAGSFEYTPAAGAELEAGFYTLRAVFRPEDAANYTTVEASAPLTVTKVTPALSWPAPAPIAYGTPLSETELNATSSVPGTFIYLPAAGAVLGAGTHRPSVVFTPAAERNCNTAKAAVKLIVTKVAPAIEWPKLAPISYGSVLGAAQLNAKASVPGTFTYTPDAGEVLSCGSHELSVTFTPVDADNYLSAQASTWLEVTKAQAAGIFWPEPRPISYGSALGPAELNAVASVAGRCVYSPEAGEVLETGVHTLRVTFTPEDANFLSTEASVTLTVEKATPAVNWPEPAPIPYGTKLSAAQLNATSSVAGAFAYTPAEGEVLPAGRHTISATFTPADSANYTTVSVSAPLTVTKEKPVLAWTPPSRISYGVPLNGDQFNAVALISGSFRYSPGVGTVLAPGRHTLLATFTPDDADNYAQAQVSVDLVVEDTPELAALMGEPSEGDAKRESQTGYADSGRTPTSSGSMPSSGKSSEIRVYNGATYVKGGDGKWHLQK